MKTEFNLTTLIENEFENVVTRFGGDGFLCSVISELRKLRCAAFYWQKKRGGPKKLIYLIMDGKDEITAYDGEVTPLKIIRPRKHLISKFYVGENQ